MAVEAEACRELVRRYYDELWNEWQVDLIDELLSPDLRFRGSLGTTFDGLDPFRGYLLGMQRAIPDLHHEVEMLVVEPGDEAAAAAARLTYSGTHEGELFGVRGTGHHISYQGATFFHVEGSLITELWTLGDMSALERQLLGTPT